MKEIIIALIVIILILMVMYYNKSNSEGFLTPNQFSGMTRGYNRTYSNDGYAKAVCKLSEAEVMHLQDIKLPRTGSEEF